MADTPFRFVTPEGEVLDPEDAPRVIPLAAEHFADAGRLKAFLRALADLSAANGRLDGAIAYHKELATRADSEEEAASHLLSMGMLCEQCNEYGWALEWYGLALRFRHVQDAHVLYFLHNNLAFCLNLAGRYEEALRHCLAATGIEPRRHNAHKNLAVALEALGRFDEAARSYVEACHIAPGDPRALRHLETLLDAHPEILSVRPELAAQVEACRQAARISFQ